jgi:Family of unknown function (DUF5991)
MKNLLLIFSVLLFCGCKQSTTKFAGIYHFDKDLALDSITGNSPFISYKISIDSNEQAVVEISGFQMDRRFLASVKMINKSATLFFLKYDYFDGNIEYRDSFDNANNQYFKNIPLLSFAYEKDGRLITNWGQIKPTFISYEASGYYFSKEPTAAEISAKKEEADELNKEAQTIILAYMNKTIKYKKDYQVVGFGNLQKISNRNYYYKMQHTYLARVYSDGSSVIYEYEQDFYLDVNLNIVDVEQPIVIRGPVSL